jgi:hypothetical protein
LAEDLQKEFPGTAGFSPQNVWFMRSFYLAWQAMPQKLSQAGKESKTAILSQAVRELPASALPAPISELPWGHNRLLLTKPETPATRLWHAHKAIEHGWSRAVLTHHIEAQLHKREGKAVTNFPRTLPPQQSDLAEQTLKDPYNFDFLTLRSDGQVFRSSRATRRLFNHIFFGQPKRFCRPPRGVEGKPE